MTPDPTELAYAAGSALAAFMATWAALVRPLKKSSVGTAELSDAKKSLEMQASVLQQRMTQAEKDAARLQERLKSEVETRKKVEARLESIEVRLAKTVTDDEFAVYTDRTTQAINNLTDRVGRVTGALDGILAR